MLKNMPKKKEGALSPEKSIVLFEQQSVRRIWSEQEEKWYFSIVDIVRVLTEQPDFQTARKYWNKLKERLGKEGNESVTKCHQLKLLAQDGKKRETDVSDVETALRIIQSIPSPKAEPFKLWLAKVGYERLQETVDPERSLNRARKNWQALGYSEKWIEQRMRGQEVRNKLTDYWGTHGLKEDIEYAKLTDVIHSEWTGMTTRKHKNLKKLKRENLRDHMTEAELIFTALAELSTNQIADAEKAEGYMPNARAAKKGGGVAKSARKLLESKTGKSIISNNNFLSANGQKKLNK